MHCTKQVALLPPVTLAAPQLVTADTVLASSRQRPCCLLPDSGHPPAVQVTSRASCQVSGCRPHMAAQALDPLCDRAAQVSTAEPLPLFNYSPL